MTSLQSKIQQLEAELAEIKKQVEEESGWKPEINEGYWFVDGSGHVYKNMWKNDEVDQGRLEMSNCFPTKEAAKAHNMLLMSMAKKKYVPKKGEFYFYTWPSATDNNWLFSREYWGNSADDIENYLLGRVFKTEAQAQEWIDSFSRYWSI